MGKIYVINIFIELEMRHLVQKPETSDQPDRETCALKCHYL